MKNIRLWKLGDHRATPKIMPTKQVFNQLMKVLKEASDPDTVDIIWDTMLDVSIISLDSEGNVLVQKA